MKSGALSSASDAQSLAKEDGRNNWSTENSTLNCDICNVKDFSLPLGWVPVMKWLVYCLHSDPNRAQKRNVDPLPTLTFLYVYWLNGWKALTLTVCDLRNSQVMKHINNPVFQMILTKSHVLKVPLHILQRLSFLICLLYFLLAGSWWPTKNLLKRAATFHGRQQIPRVRTGLTFRCGLTSRGENLVRFGLPWLSRGDFGPPILSCCHSAKIFELLPCSWDAYRLGFHGMKVWDWTGDLHLRSQKAILKQFM